MKVVLKNLILILLKNRIFRFLFELRNLTSTSTLFSIKYIFRPDLKARYDFFLKAAFYIQMSNLHGSYHEFGCADLNTIRMALDTLGYRYKNKNDKALKFYLYDTFYGMPKLVSGDDPHWCLSEGMNCTTMNDVKKNLKKDIKRIKMFPGIYSESLKKIKNDEVEKISLAYLDCDYYSSTRDALEYCKDKFVNGSIIAFDDWNLYACDQNKGQRKAYNEFNEKYKKNYIFEEFSDVGFTGKAFSIRLIESDI
tara:strand:- start:99 stop:854 length:756 start_codon:yes stop_codon:yes gene_type:complete